MGIWSTRRYENVPADTQGILAVEQSTFGECPYTAVELQALFAAPEQRLWLAEASEGIIGFVAGLAVSGLWGPRLEADLLAVHPDWQGQGIASALLAALRRGAASIPTLRGVVHTANVASEHAFARAGFRSHTSVHDLLLRRILGRVPCQLPRWGGIIRPIGSEQEALQAVTLAPAELPPGEHIWQSCHESGLTLLAALAPEGIAGIAELVEVRTMLYAGLWLETIHVSQGRPQALRALIAAAVELAKERDLDTVGCLVPQGRQHLRAALQAEGFASLDSYRIWAAGPLAPAEANA